MRGIVSSGALGIVSTAPRESVFRGGFVFVVFVDCHDQFIIATIRDGLLKEVSMVDEKKD